MRTRALVAAVAGLGLLAMLGCWNSSTYPPLERHRIDASNHGTYFPIIGSAVHAGMDCEACHGGTPTFLQFTCIACHDHARAHTDSTHVTVTGYAYADTACYDCHRDGTASGVDHARFFPIGTGTRHSAQQCGDCHTNPHNHLIFTCISCHSHAQAHTDSTHTGVAGYAYESHACLSCHPNAEVMTRDQHTPFFPIATGAHAANPCGDCHQTPGRYEYFTCISCHDHAQAHTDSTHAGVGGYVYDSPSCRSCHPQGTVVTRAEHQIYFPIASGLHADASCSACHQTADFRAFTCISCHNHAQAHTDSTHTGVAGYAYESHACLSCHPNAEVMTRDLHTPFFPIATGAHAANPCGDCHQTPGRYEYFTCISCHDHSAGLMDPAHVGLPGYTYDSPSCLSCHPQGTVVTRAEHQIYFPIASGLHADASCSACHQTADFRAFTCISCHNHAQAHTDSTHTGVAGYAYESHACLSCHPNAEVMTRDLHTPFFPITTGAHAANPCGDCHQTPGRYEYFTCISCHDHSAGVMDPAHAGLPGYTYDSPSCLSCHPQGTFMTRAQHQSIFPIASGTHALACGDCHTTPRDFSKFECILCHTHACSLMDPRHTEVGGYSCASRECYRCHPTGQGGGQ